MYNMCAKKHRNIDVTKHLMCQHYLNFICHHYCRANELYSPPLSLLYVSCIKEVKNADQVEKIVSSPDLSKLLHIKPGSITQLADVLGHYSPLGRASVNKTFLKQPWETTNINMRDWTVVPVFINFMCTVAGFALGSIFDANALIGLCGLGD